jgi:torulene dioxygenase
MATSWPNDMGFDTDYEEHEPVALTVKGKIPEFAAGVLYRTGPLGFKTETEAGNIWAAKHWFDGFSCVHRFQIDFENGEPHVTYRSRRTVDETIENVRKNGKLDGITFASKRDPCESIFQKVMGMFYAKSSGDNIGVTLSIKSVYLYQLLLDNSLTSFSPSVAWQERPVTLGVMPRGRKSK